MTRPSKASLLVIFVTVFIDLLGFGIVMPVLPRYAKAFEADKLTLGLLMASFSAMQFLFAPLWGSISDRIGRRPVLLVGLAGAAIFYGLFGYATSLGKAGAWFGLSTMTWLFVSRIGAGIACATIPTAQAYIADITGTGERAKGMAIIGAAFGIGFTFGPLIGAFSVSDGLRQRLTELLPALSSVFGQVTTESAPQAPSALPGFIASGMSAIAFLFAFAKLKESLQPGVSASASHSHLARIGSAFKLPGVAAVLLTIFLTTFAFAQFESTLSLLTGAIAGGAESFGTSDQDNFLVFAYVGIVLTIAQGGIVRRLATKMAPQVLALSGAIIMVAGLALIGVAGQQHSIGQLFAVLPITVLGFASMNPSLQAILSLRTPVERQGEVLGVGQSMSALARILGPIAGMRLFDESALPRAYWVAAGLMTLGVLLIVLLGKRTTAEKTLKAEPPN